MPTFPYSFRQQILYIDHRKTAKKNIILRTVAEDTLRVGTPKWFDRTALLAWLDAHPDVIAQALAKYRLTPQNTQQRPSEILYRGRLLPLREHSGSIVLFSADAVYLPQAEWPQQQTALQHSLKRQAAETLLPRLSQHAATHGFPLGKSALSSAKTFWGVCRQRDIRLNWRLIGAPDDVVDYVCIHELCHITHPNHSPDFWQAVSRYTPHTARSKQWLKENGGRLFVAG